MIILLSPVPLGSNIFPIVYDRDKSAIAKNLKLIRKVIVSVENKSVSSL